MTSTTKDIVWLYWLLANIRVFLPHPTSMYCDNKSSIQITHNLMNEPNTLKLIATLHVITSSMVTLPFVSSSLQFADFFTKSHSVFHFCFLVDKLSMLIVAAS